MNSVERIQTLIHRIPHEAPEVRWALKNKNDWSVLSITKRRGVELWCVC
jgi:hypothetical protein